jgi:putative FmdB family regulatory protein
MPIYEYKCKKCGKLFEHLARTLSEAAPKCPSCGAPRPEKQLSVFSAAVASDSSVCDTCPSSGKCPSASSCCGDSCGLD